MNYNKDEIKSFLIENYVSKNKRYIKFDIANPDIFNSIKNINRNINDGSFNITRHIWHILQSSIVPTCKHETCTELSKWNRTHYNDYCSTKCANSSKKKKEEVNKTLMKNYGNTLGKNKAITDKRRKTMIDKYGVKSTFESRELMEKAKATNIERYGFEYPTQNSEIINKIKTTNIERYGFEYPTQNSEIINKIKATNIERYGGCSPMSSEMVRTKVYNTMMTKYGVVHARQKHLSTDTIEKMNDIAWLKTEHHVLKKSCAQIADELGIHIKSITRIFSKLNIKQYYYGGSKYERELLEFFDINSIKTIHNDRKLIKPYEIDVVLPEHNICIEFCGLYWHCDIYKDKNYHKMKYTMCKKLGYNLITIYEDEWVNNKELVKNILLHKLGKSTKKRVFARKCEIVPCIQSDAKDFLNKNHIQGLGNASIYCAMMYEDEIVAVMGFKKNKSYYELNRYATSNIVIGGFSKLFKYFVKRYNPNKVVSFVDLRWNVGTTYENAEFKFDKELPPDYHYVLRGKKYHKFNFRKSKLSKKLYNFNPELSERTNCKNNGIHRIYDCGKKRLVWGYEK